MVSRLNYAALLAAAVALSACSRSNGDRGGDTTATMLNAQDPDTSLTGPLTESNILALFDGASFADSSVSAIAASKGSSDVRDFARRMMRDHHALRRELERLAKRIGVTPELPAGEDFSASTQTFMDSLNATPKGTDFDKAYVDHEVDAHLDMLEIANTAMTASRDAEVKAFIQKAAPTIQSHLDAAQALQKNSM